jgi:cysteine desulfurase
MACALELAEQLRTTEVRRLRGLSARLRAGLKDAFPDVVLSGPKRDSARLPGLVHASFPHVEARRLIVHLERAGVYVGTGSACAASKMRVSHVLKAMGVPEDVARGSLRISMGRSTSQEDVDFALRAIVDAVAQEQSRVRA